MRTRNLVILAAIVLAVAAYVFFFEKHRPTSDESKREAEKVLRDFDRDQVTGLVIEHDGSRVRIEKVGEDWRLREPLDFPADSSLVSSTLGSLANLTADRRLTAAEIDPVAYGLEHPADRVTLHMADGSERVLEVGDELPLGSKRALRVDQGGEIVVASGWFVSDLERKVDDWRSHDVVDISEDTIASIDIESGPDTIRAARVDDRWQLLRPLQDLADADHLSGLVSDLRSMRIVEFLGDDAKPSDLGLDVPEYEITIVRTDGGEPLRLDLGATRDGDAGTEVACRRGDSELFWASDRVRTRLSKAPVLWRSKKVMPFETWDVETLNLTTPETSVALAQKESVWRFADDSEAKPVAVQDRLRALASLEATDYDLMEPPTREMGTAEVGLKKKGDEEHGAIITFTFFAPLSEGGRAAVKVSGRNTVMGVNAADVEKILGDLDDLRDQPSEEPADDTATE